MQTIRLQLNNSSYKQLMKFLQGFNKEELQIITEDNEFLSVQNYLQKELLSIEEGKTEFINLDQLNLELEDVIQKYEG